MDKRFLGILAALFIIFAGIFVVNQNSGSNSSSGKGGSQPTNHVTGQNQKKVTLIEYGDYQCPICGAYYQPTKEITIKYANDIKFQFRNLPLVSLHPNAFAAARAAEAAGMQGKYFEMHDKLYEGQQAWSTSTSPLQIFQGYAKDLGLDVTKFKTDYASGKINDAINADLDAFKKTKQEMATPTFFINGRYVKNSDLSDPTTGAPSVEKMSKLIDAEIAKQKQ